MPRANSARDRKEARYHKSPRETEIIVHTSAPRKLWNKDKEMFAVLFKINIFERRNWENVSEMSRKTNLTHTQTFLRGTYSKGHE